MEHNTTTGAEVPKSNVEAVYDKELHIVEQKNVTAIVREDSPETHKRWDREYNRVEKVDAANNRSNAVGLALSALRDDPSFSPYPIRREAAENAPVYDFWGEDVLPLADRIHDYLTQDVIDT